MYVHILYWFEYVCITQVPCGLIASSLLLSALCMPSAELISFSFLPFLISSLLKNFCIYHECTERDTRSYGLISIGQGHIEFIILYVIWRLSKCTPLDRKCIMNWASLLHSMSSFVRTLKETLTWPDCCLSLVSGASLAGKEQYELSHAKCLVMGRVFGVSCQLDALGM